MQIELRAALLADPAVAAIVGGRVTWGVRAAGQPMPAVVLHLIASPKTYTMRGLSGLAEHLVQADCYGGSYAEARALCAAVSAALDGLKAPPLQAFLEDERDDDFTPGDGPDVSGRSDIFRTIIDVRVWSS